MQQFAVMHSLDAVRSRVLCVWGADAYVQGSSAVVYCRGQNVGGPQLCTWNETCDLGLCRGVTLLGCP